MSVSCRETGLVDRLLPDGRAVVGIRRAEACHSCQSKNACQVLGGQMQDFFLTVPNPIGAKPGDEVRLALDSTSVLTASAGLYLVPAGSRLCGAVIGNALAPGLDWDANAAGLLGSAFGLLAGLALTSGLNRRLGKRRAYAPRLVAVMDPTSRRWRPGRSDG